MADNTESLGELYARIGLNFDDVENSFVQVERSLRENLQRLNRADNLVRIQQRIELTGLDESADAERIFEVRTRHLNRQLENQRARLRMLQASLEDTRRRTGENSDETQRAEISFENARLAVARLENQLNQLNENHNRGTNWTDEIIEFSQKAAPVISVARSMFQAFSAINDATNNLIEKFRELQKNAYNFNLPIDKADDFTRKLRLAGAEIEDVGGYLRGITDALVKGETDDPEFIAMQRYGESIFDASGKLKNYAEIWESVHRAYQKAKAEGKEIEFLQLTGGESGVTDAIQALERWETAVENANKIVKANIDYKQLEKADIASKNLSEQFDELGKAAADAFTPATTKAAEMLFEVIKEGTQWIIDHKDGLKEMWETPSILFSPFKSYEHMLKTERAESKKMLFAMKDQDKTLKKVFETSAGLERAHEDLKKKIADKDKGVDPLHQYAIQRTNDLKDNIADLRIALDYESEYQQALKQATLERERALRQIVVGDAERAAINEKYLADIETAEKVHADKLQDLWQETAALQYEQSHSAYQKEIYDIRQWRDSALDALGDFKDWIGDKNKYVEESAAIVANAAAKEAQAYEKEIDRIKGKTMTLAEKIFEKTHSQAEIDIKNAQKEYIEAWREGIYPKEMLDLNYQLEIGKILSNLDPKYNEIPDFKFDLPDVDYYTPLNDAVDGLIESYTELDEVQRQALNLPNIPSKIDAPDLPDLPDIPAQKMNFDTSAVENFKASLETSIEPIRISTSYFENSLTHAATAIIEFENSLITAADKISKLEFSDLKSTNHFATHGSEPINRDQNKKSIPPTPKIDLPKTEPPKFTAPKTDTKVFDGMAKEMANISNKIADLTRTAGTIASKIDKARSTPANVTVAPNMTISLNLSGSYILTQAMVNQLANDCTEQVANGVTDAVTRATNNLNLKIAY